MILAQLTEHPLLKQLLYLVLAEYVLIGLAVAALVTLITLHVLNRAPRTRKVLGVVCGLAILLTLLVLSTGCSWIDRGAAGSGRTTSPAT